MQLSGIVSYYDTSLGEGGIVSKSLGGMVHFRAASLVDVKKLDAGDIVQFELGHINGIGQAVRVVLVAKASPSPSTYSRSPRPRTLEASPRSDKEECHSCHKLMVPCMVMGNGRPERSFCPFCGSVHKDFRVEQKPGLIKEVAGAAAGAAIGGFLASFISF